MLLPLQFAHSKTELKANDAYFCPALELSEDQKTALIPLIKQRHTANHDVLYWEGGDNTIFGLDLSETKESRDLAKPEDRAVRKIIDRLDAKKLENYLEEHRAQMAATQKNFPPLSGSFLALSQEVTPSETGPDVLSIIFQAQLPSSKYQFSVDEAKQENDQLKVYLSIQKPHLFELLNESPQSQILQQGLSIEAPYPTTLSVAYREIAQFDSKRKYEDHFEQPLLKSTE